MALIVNNLILDLQKYLSGGRKPRRSTGKNINRRCWRSRNVPAHCQTYPKRVKQTADNIKAARPTIHKKGRSQIRSGRREERYWKRQRELFPLLANVIRIDQDATQDSDVVMEDAPMLDAPDRLAICQSSCQVVAFSHMSYSWEERQGVVFLGAPREIKSLDVGPCSWDDHLMEDRPGCSTVIDQLTPAMHATPLSHGFLTMIALPMRIENRLHAPKTAFMAFTAQTVLPLYSSPRNDDRLEELVHLMAGLKISSLSDDIPEPQFIHLKRQLPWYYKTFFSAKQVREIEKALVRISSKRDRYQQRLRKRRREEVLAIQYLEAADDPTVGEKELQNRMADLRHAFHLRTAGMPKKLDWCAKGAATDNDWTSNITPRRICPTSKRIRAPPCPPVPDHLAAAKVHLLNRSYKRETPLLKTVMWRNMRTSLAESFAEVRDRSNCD